MCREESMKKLFVFLFSLILSVVFSTSASAYDVMIYGIYYNLNYEGKTAEVTYGKVEYLGEVIIPSSITVEGKEYTVVSIGDGAFRACSVLTSVTIPNSVTSIETWAFQYCSGLTSIIIGNSVKSIGDGAFQHCSGLTSVTIPNSVTSIGNSAFYGCSFTSVTIPNSVTSIGNNAFSHCVHLTSVIIPNSLTSIGNRAFYWCYRLTSVTIPSSVISIGNEAFYDCSGLTSVTIPSSVISIGNDAFSGCKGLTSVTIPNSVTSIGARAFQRCRSVTSVTIGNSVTSIKKEAFEECSKLENVCCYAENVPSTDVSAFNGSNIESSTLHVPSSALSLYEATTPWKRFGTIKALNDTPTNINTSKTRGVVIQSAGGFITLSGLDTNERVDFYAIDGVALGSATATDGTATFSATNGTIVVAKIGKESVKIAVE